MTEGGMFRHYKGGIYRVICRARDADTGDATTVYQDIATGRIYHRPESEFEGSVTIRPHVGLHVTKPRFAKMEG